VQFLKVESHGTVKGFFLSAVGWWVAGNLAGLIASVQLVAPDLLGNIAIIVFGRIRQVHTNLIMFAFVGTGLLGAAHFLVPTLVRAPLYSERLGKIILWLWNLALAAGVVTLSLGYTQNREYAEFIWPIDIAVLAAFALMFYNLLETIKRRRENILYVSVWYIFGGVIFTFFTYLFGNAVWHPETGSLTGMPDAILAWFYGHNILGFFFTTLAVAVAYYVLPIVCRAPLYSHTLSLIGFWSILIMYSHIGTHHLMQAPAPTWLKVVAITGSIGMVIPVLVVLVNLWLTMRGRLGSIHDDIGGKFVFTGTVWYLLTCLQGPLQAMPTVQRLTHFTNWVIAHSHMGILGFTGMVTIGGIYFIIPRITGRPLYSRRLADLQYWLVLIGMVTMFVVLTIAGLIQGSGWLNGEDVYRILPQIHLYMVLRAATALPLLIAAVIGVFNIFMSLYRPAGESA
jgi:cytochrome c oxidase cbb3-type subunit I